MPVLLCLHTNLHPQYRQRAQTASFLRSLVLALQTHKLLTLSNTIFESWTLAYTHSACRHALLGVRSNRGGRLTMQDAYSMLRQAVPWARPGIA